jgi:hypothetical protein
LAEIIRGDPGDTQVLEARYLRGKLLLEQGRRPHARKDLARVHADDPTYRDTGALLDAAGGASVRRRRRESIPRAVKDEVWRRDEGSCVECGSQADLEFDHVISLALGGSNTARNLQLLCAPCNRSKGADL